MKNITQTHVNRLGYKSFYVEIINEAEKCVDAQIGDLCVELFDKHDDRLKAYDNFVGWVPHFFNNRRILYYFRV